MTAPELVLPEEPTPIERWGKDHWSTYAYAHTRAVDYGGLLSRAHMRGCNDGMFSIPTDGSKYPTRLKGYFDHQGDPDYSIQDHTDLDCLLDAAAYGLLTIERDGSGSHASWRVTFTPKGNVLAGKLAAHKADGGNFAGFDPSGAALGLHVAGPATKVGG